MACTVLPRPMSSARRRRPCLDTAKLQENTDNVRKLTKMIFLSIYEDKFSHRAAATLSEREVRVSHLLDLHFSYIIKKAERL